MMRVWVYDAFGYFFLSLFGGSLGYTVWSLYKKMARYFEEDFQINKRVEKIKPQKSDAQEWLQRQNLRKLDLAHVEFSQGKDGLLSHLQKALRRCGPTMSWTRFLLMVLGLSCLWIFLLWITKRTQGSNTLMIGSGLGLFTAYQGLVVVGSKRDDAFLRLFPEVLETMIRTVRAGATIERSIRIVGDKLQEPFGSVFRNISHQVQVGVPLDYALKQTADNLMLEDFRFFSIVLIIQQETGGTLADILNKLSTLIRARQELRLKMHALTSESRTSALIVGALPVGFGLILQVLSPGHFAPFFSNPTGQVLLNVAIGFLGFGFFVLWKMTKIKV